MPHQSLTLSFSQVANIAGGLKRKDWYNYTLPTGPLEWPEYVPEPPKKTTARSTGKSYPSLPQSLAPLNPLAHCDN